MKVQYASDLHLEFPGNSQYLRDNPLVPTGNVLLLAGDIMPFLYMPLHNDFFDWLSDNFEHTYWVPGNHEYYYSDIISRSGNLNESIRSNVHLVNNHVVEIGDTQILLTTLWSKISEIRYKAVKRGMADFHHINNNGEYFAPEDFNKLHDECFAFLQQACSGEKKGKRVVVTHHVPTMMYYPEEYRGSIINEAFAVELREFIKVANIDSWIYGHHHRNIPGYQIGNCNMLTNQLGYVDENEHTDFDKAKCL